MVFRNQKEQGSRLPVDLRLGVTIEKFGGLDLESDASAIADGRFRILNNVRKTRGPYRERGGQVKSNATSMGLVEGFMDASDLGAPHTGVAATVESGAETGFGRYIYFTMADPAQSDSRALGRFDTWELKFEYRPLAPAGEYRGLYIAADQELYASGRIGANGVVVKLTWANPVVVTNVVSVPLTNGFGRDGVAVITGISLTFFRGWGLSGSLVEDPTSPGHFYATEAFDATLGPPGRTYKDGVLDDTPGIAYSNANTSVAAFLGAFNGTVYSGWGGPKAVAGGTGTIRKRTGAATWANLALPAPPAGYHYAAIGNPVVFQDKLWFAGSYLKDTAGAGTVDLTIYSVTAADVVTQEHQWTTNTPVASGLIVFHGKLYVLYADKDLLYTKLAMLDPVSGTWTDIHWDGKIDGVQMLFMSVRRANDALWAIAYDGYILDNGIGNYWLIRSDGGNTKKWEKILQITPAAGVYRPIGDIVSRNT